jgi:hypothetical protein
MKLTSKELKKRKDRPGSGTLQSGLMQAMLERRTVFFTA